ncbi:MAG: hypothetical protein LBR96_02920 [Treponema sp.]|jgi:uncharacterized Zn finger protein|nr:hypothetical protein [Treponema sp.]
MNEHPQPPADDLCAVYCPSCKEAANAVSFNLLVKAESVYLKCIKCGQTTIITLDKDGVVEIENGI